MQLAVLMDAGAQHGGMHGADAEPGMRPAQPLALEGGSGWQWRGTPDSGGDGESLGTEQAAHLETRNRPRGTFLYRKNDKMTTVTSPSRREPWKAG